MKTRVAIQGISGSFHHQAAEKLLGEDIQPVNCHTFKDVFDTVKQGDTEYGVVAVENNLYGSINAVYRLLARNPIWVMGEVFLKVEQYLIKSPGHPKDLDGIKKVISQAPALEQCELWLEANLPHVTLEEFHDTAESVREVVAKDDSSLAAIAGQRAAEVHNGEIVAGPINDDKHNYTRFFLLTKDKSPPKNADKTSIILETGHRPGALYNALGAFADRGVNLSKLDSHPIAGDRQHYAFYTDFEAGLDKDFDHPVLKDLRSQDCKVTVLGSYKSANGILNGYNK